MGRHLTGDQIRVEVGTEHADPEGARVAADRLRDPGMQRNADAAFEAHVTLADFGKQVICQPQMRIDLESVCRAAAEQQHHGSEASYENCHRVVPFPKKWDDISGVRFGAASPELGMPGGFSARACGR